MNFIYDLNENEFGTHPGGLYAVMQGPGDPWYINLISVNDDGGGAYSVAEGAMPIETTLRSDNGQATGPIMDGSYSGQMGLSLGK